MNIYLSCYHKTGTYFLMDLQNILQKYDTKNKYIFDGWSQKANKIDVNSKNTKIIHFIRNPYEIIVSGFLYHKICKEPWCVDIKAKTAANGINYNFNGMSYQTILNYLNIEDGINFEMKGRSYNTILDMYNCKFNNFDFCLNVQMEELFADVDKTILKILSFINNDDLYNLDYSSLHLENNNKNKNHSTNKNLTINRYTTIFTPKNYICFNNLFQNIDKNKYNYNIIN